jgi:hypothetical protein
MDEGKYSEGGVQKTPSFLRVTDNRDQKARTLVDDVAKSFQYLNLIVPSRG